MRGFLGLLLAAALVSPARAADVGWPSYNGSLESHRFSPLTDITANYWLSTWVFEQVATKIIKDGGTVDAASMLAGMNDLTDFDTGGMTPPISTTVPFVTPAAIPIQLPRMFNPTVVQFVIKKGKLKQVSPDFINPFEKV